MQEYITIIEGLNNINADEPKIILINTLLNRAVFNT